MPIIISFDIRRFHYCSYGVKYAVLEAMTVDILFEVILVILQCNRTMDECLVKGSFGYDWKLWISLNEK